MSTANVSVHPPGHEGRVHVRCANTHLPCHEGHGQQEEHQIPGGDFLAVEVDGGEKRRSSGSLHEAHATATAVPWLSNLNIRHIGVDLVPNQIWRWEIRRWVPGIEH